MDDEASRPDQEAIRQWVEERAAIMEFEGKLSRSESECRAGIDASRQFCPTCQAEECGGCQCAAGLTARKQKAAAVLENAKKDYSVELFLGGC